MHITYEQLLELISWGVFTKKMKGTSIVSKELKDIIKKKDRMVGAEYNGIYVGSPGRDIFYSLSYLSDKQMQEVAEELSLIFPKIPSGHHVQTSACIRQIYGMFQKGGILLSSEKMNKMKEDSLDWSLPRKFLKLLCDEFKKIENYYGLCIVYEIDGHRFGDEAVLNKSKKQIILMKEAYEKSIKYAYKSMSYKQLFTPYYWGGKYFAKYGNKMKASEWFDKMLRNFNKHGAPRSGVYRAKLRDAIRSIKKYDPKRFNNIYSMYITNKKVREDILKKILIKER